MRRLLVVFALAGLPACSTLHELTGDQLDVPATAIVGVPVPVKAWPYVSDDWNRAYFRVTWEAGNEVRLRAFAMEEFRMFSIFSAGSTLMETTLVFVAPGRYTVRFADQSAAIVVAAP